MTRRKRGRWAVRWAGGARRVREGAGAGEEEGAGGAGGGGEGQHPLKQIVSTFFPDLPTSKQLPNNDLLSRYPMYDVTEDYKQGRTKCFSWTGRCWSRHALKRHSFLKYFLFFFLLATEWMNRDPGEGRKTFIYLFICISVKKEKEKNYLQKLMQEIIICTFSTKPIIKKEEELFSPTC